MKITSINLQFTKNIGNYESVRIGGEWSVDDADNVTAAYKNAASVLNSVYKEMMNPTPAKPAEPAQATPTPAKERLVFGSSKFQAVCNKICSGAVKDIETIREYFDFGEDEEKAFNMAFQLYK